MIYYFKVFKIEELTSVIHCYDFKDSFSKRNQPKCVKSELESNPRSKIEAHYGITMNIFFYRIALTFSVMFWPRAWSFLSYRRKYTTSYQPLATVSLRTGLEHFSIDHHRKKNCGYYSIWDLAKIQSNLSDRKKIFLFLAIVLLCCLRLEKKYSFVSWYSTTFVLGLLKYSIGLDPHLCIIWFSLTISEKLFDQDIMNCQWNSIIGLMYISRSLSKLKIFF